MAKGKKTVSTLNTERIENYTHYLELPLKLVGCWDWYPTTSERKLITNYVYLCLVIFFLTHVTIMLLVHIYTEWVDIMSGLDKVADCLPYLASLFIVSYFAVYRSELRELVHYMDVHFQYHSARGLTNMTMARSYSVAKNFAYTYTACALSSAILYAVMPILIHWWTKNPLQGWFFMDVTQSPFVEIAFLRQLLSQLFMGLALGQLSAFFATNSILLCGQLDILCCSVRNVRFTALLQLGVRHDVLVTCYRRDIREDERHNYMYNQSEMTDSSYHYDDKVSKKGTIRSFDIYSGAYDERTERALRECAVMSRAVARYKSMFERLASPLLVLRVVQVTLYLCTLLYYASRKFDTMTVEYLIAVAVDIFIYCYYGNQIIIQADRVSTAAYQSWWQTMGVRPRRLLVNILLAHRRQVAVRAGRFLRMDLTTYVNIIKTSFSYYTLLVNVNEH